MNRMKQIQKRLLAVMLSVLLVLLPCSAILAETATTSYSFADINLAVSVPSSLVSFTRTVTSSNSQLDLIGVDNVEELRGLMIANGIYLEAVPKDVSYEIVIHGKAADSSARNFNELSLDELQTQFDSYIQAFSDAKSSSDSSNADGTSNSNIVETVTGTSIYTNDTTSYFVVDVTSVSNNAVTTYVKKYYTVMMGNVIQFTLQSNGQAVSDEMANQLAGVVDSAQYKPIKKTLQDNAFLTEIVSSLATLGVPIVLLALLAFIVGRSTKKSNKQIEKDAKSAKERYERRNNHPEQK